MPSSAQPWLSGVLFKTGSQWSCYRALSSPSGLQSDGRHCSAWRKGQLLFSLSFLPVERDATLLERCGRKPQSLPRAGATATLSAAKTPFSWPSRCRPASPIPMDLPRPPPELVSGLLARKPEADRGSLRSSSMLGFPVSPRRSALQYCLVLLVSSVDPLEALCLNTDHFASSLLATLYRCAQNLHIPQAWLTFHLCLTWCLNLERERFLWEHIVKVEWQKHGLPSSVDTYTRKYKRHNHIMF